MIGTVPGYGIPCGGDVLRTLKALFSACNLNGTAAVRAREILQEHKASWQIVAGWLSTFEEKMWHGD